MLSSSYKLLLRPSLCVFLLMIICICCSSSRTLEGHDDEFSIVGYSPEKLTSMDKLVELFESWMLKHGKSYESTEEKLHRFEIFKDNLKHIDERNRELQVISSYWLGLNEFSDMSHEEFKNKYLTGLKPDDELSRRSHHDSSIRSSGSYSEIFLYKNVEDLPQSVDWRKKGAVTHVKNQNPCGGCWAFSAVAAVEGINQIVTGNLTALSEQELLSCDTNNFGCEGGLLFYAFEYIASNGIHTEEDYPFVGDQDQASSSCKLIKKVAAEEVVTISGYQNVPENDEQSLLKALANQPVSVGIEASSKDFQHYSGGIFDGSCGTYPNHAVTAVGYGSSSSPEAVDYIIVKNSWGPKWGEVGYVRIKRNTGLPGGLCAINKLASFPIKFKTSITNSI